MMMMMNDDDYSIACGKRPDLLCVESKVLRVFLGVDHEQLRGRGPKKSKKKKIPQFQESQRRRSRFETPSSLFPFPY